MTGLVTRPVMLTREQSVFRLAFAYREELVERARELPYAVFDPETKSWTAAACGQTLDLLNRMYYDGLIDVPPTSLLVDGETLDPAPAAILRAGSIRRCYLVATAQRDETLYAKLRAIPGAQWERKAAAMSYPPSAGVALAELVERGLLADPERLLSPAGVTVAFDARSGKFAIRGDDRAARVFTQHFPTRDVMAIWREKGLDVAFDSEFSAEVYHGELARVSGALQPSGLLAELYPYQAQSVAVAVERSGFGVFDGPGLGKTLTAIATGYELLVNRREIPRILCVVPGTARTQWAAEITRFTGHEDVVVIIGDTKARAAAYERATTARWVIVNYDLLSRDFKQISPLASGALIVADEAHRCFPAGTTVLTQAGPRDIREIVENREELSVLAWDEDRRILAYKPITAWMSSPAPDQLVRVVHGAGELVCTASHPIWTEERGYVAAVELAVGETLRHVQVVVSTASACVDALARVVDVEILVDESTSALVYNLEVDGFNSYVADGIVVHNCKNPTAKRTQALRKLSARAHRRLALTGTPVENEPGEWYSILSGYTIPGLFGSPMDFLGRYQYPGRFGGFEGARRLPELRERSRPHYIRHTKAEVAQHLPPLQVYTIRLDPDPAYAAALRRAHHEAREEIRTAALNRQSRNRAPGSTEDGEIETAAEMTAVGMLKLLCISPRLVLNSNSDAAAAMRDAGIVPDEDGPKLDHLRTMISEMHAEGERVLVFCASRSMTDLVAQRLTEDQVPYVLYTGETSDRDRDAAVAAFQTPPTEENPGPTVMVATDAGSEALNLGRSCSTVINLDVPWKSTTLEQRGNRVHRIDGTAPRYQVINLVLTGTLEHGLLAMVERKADLQDAILGESGGRRRTTGGRGRNLFETALEEWADNPS